MSPKSTKRHTLLAVAALALAAGSANAAPYLTEDFESYIDNATLLSTWTSSGTSTGTNPQSLRLQVDGFDPTPTQLATQTAGVSKMGRFANGNHFAYRTLTENVSAGTPWSVKIDMALEGYARSIAFGLFDETGTNGYVFRINATNVNQNSGRGAAVLYEHSGAPVIGGGDYGTAFNVTRPTYAVDANNVPTGAPTGYTVAGTANGLAPVTGFRRLTGTDATTPADQNAVTFDANWQGLITWNLTFDPATGRLAIYNDSLDNPNPTTVPVAEVTDATPLNQQFSRFYLLGQNADYDNITVDAIPEPGSAALVAAGAAAFGLRRRRN